jgi:WD40-like Beta Propeller Repeat
VRRELERIEIPGEHEARERTWEIVRSAYAEREPEPRRAPFVRPLLAAAAVAALAAAALSPPGRAVLEDVREAIGVASADEALFSLPAGGRMLVVSSEGAWTVSPDGSKRLLGPYRDASWSPFGRFVVGATPLQLAALEPDGDKRWTLARPDVRSPRWGGSRTDTRIAYLSGGELHVVAGDGRGDRVLARSTSAVAPAWRPATLHVLAYVQNGRIVVADVVGNRRLWTRRAPGATNIEWSRDGGLLLVQGPSFLRVYDESGGLKYDLLDGRRGAATVTAAAFSPRNVIAFVQRARGRSFLWTIPRLRPDASAARQLFSGPGAFRSITWSPDGDWIAVVWPNADQLVFVPASGTGRVRAVGNVAEQFGSGTSPRITGWCCS